MEVIHRRSSLSGNLALKCYMIFLPTRTSCKSLSPSSRAWLARQYRDPYVKSRLVDPAAYRSRSAFKLLDINENYGSFLTKPHVRTVVDLGAAPGGWSQVVAGKLGWRKDDLIAGSLDNHRNEVKKEEEGSWSSSGLSDYNHDDVSDSKLSKRLRQKAQQSYSKTDELGEHFDPLNIDDNISTVIKGRGTIIAIDRLYIRPIPGVHTLQVDFLSIEAPTLIKALLNSAIERPGTGDSFTAEDDKVDIILSDMAANTSGNSVKDTESSLQICEAVFKFTQQHLRSAESIGKRRGGVLLLKHFIHPFLQLFRSDHLEPNFHDVKFIKPDSSRASSSEGYWLCQGWKGSKVT